MRLALAVVLVALAVPGVAQAYPDWRSPTVLGLPQDGRLRFPQAVAYDTTLDPDPNAPAGPYVYVGDQYSFAIQKFTADGRFVRRFGGYGSEPGHIGATSSRASASPTSGTVGGVGGVAVDAAGHVYVLDSFNSRIERFSPRGEFEGTFGTFGSAPGELDTGIHGGIAVLGNWLYLADQNNNRVQRFHLGLDGLPDGPPLVFGSAGTGPGQFNLTPGIAIDPARDHDVFVVDDRNNRIHRFSADGAFEAVGGATRLDQPYDAGVDNAGRLFVADNQNHRVVRFDATTLAYVRAFGTGPGRRPNQLNNTRAIAVAPDADASGGVFAANTSLGQIAEFGVDGAFIRSWGEDGRAPGAFMNPRDVAVAPNGDVVVVNTRADSLTVLRAGGAIEIWGRISTNIDRPVPGVEKGEYEDPTAVAVDPRNGDVLVAEGGNHRVQRLHLDGDKATAVVYGGTSAGSTVGRFREPLGIAVAADGAVWVADTRNNRLQRLDPVGGAWSEFPGFVRPTEVAVLSDGRLAVTELGAEADVAAGKGRLTLLAPDGTRLASYEGLDRPEGVASDGHGGVLVADTQHDRLLGFSVAGSQLRLEHELGEPGQFARPIGIEVDRTGRLLVVDTYHNQLLRYEAPAVYEPATVGGTVPGTLELKVGAGGTFPGFVPGAARTYTASVPVDVLSTAGDAALTVADPSPVAPGRLTNGASALARPLRAGGAELPAVVKTWSAPAAHDSVVVEFTQEIAGDEPLRTGTYAKTLTFTLTTTRP